MNLLLESNLFSYTQGFAESSLLSFIESNFHEVDLNEKNFSHDSNVTALASKDIRPIQPGECFVEGEVVAVFAEFSECWCSAKVIKIDKNIVWYQHPDFDVPVSKLCSSIQKIIVAAAPVSPTLSVAMPFDVASLMREFAQRPFGWLSLDEHTGASLFGYHSNEGQEVVDQQRLVRIIKAHNQQFFDRAQIVECTEHCKGYMEELQLSSGTEMFVRADLHSDLASLISTLQMLQAAGYLDAQYKCRPGFHIVLLGDYIDRGTNDIEIMSLLLSLRMENPNSVHLIRGNHEDIEITAQYAPHRAFLLSHEHEFSKCFDSFPLAFCVSSQEKFRDIYHYVHFSHSLFSLSSMQELGLCGKNSLIPIFDFSRFPSSIGLSLEKAQRAFFDLREKFQNVPEALQFSSFNWSDIGEVFGPSPRGRGYVFSPNEIQLYSRASKTAQTKICAFFRGHQHIFREHVVPRKPIGSKDRYKVLVTTLPAALATGFFDRYVSTQEIQGFMLNVRPRAKDWEKSPVFLKLDSETHFPSFKIHRTTENLFDPVLDLLPPSEEAPVE